MKKYILPFMSIAMLMSMASCSSSDDEVAEIKEESKLVPMTFTATQESNVGTRAELGTENFVVWQKSDAISVFDGTGADHNKSFTLEGDGGETSGSFTGTASSTATKFTAVYPYTSVAQLESDGIVNGITLPAEQTATADSFDPKAALMIAYTTDKTKLEFKNAVSLVKIQTDFACKKIVLSTNEDIAGTGTLKYNEGTPSITFESNQSKTVTLKPHEGQDKIASGTYYIAVKPGTLSSGWSISFTSTDYNVYTRKANSGVTFNRGKIRSIGTFNDKTTNWTHTSRGSVVRAYQEVDMGEFTIDSKKYRVIFAKSNLTVTGLAANKSDFGDYFAWGAKEPWLTSYTYDGSGYEDANFTNKIWKGGKENGYTETNAPTLSKSYNSHDVLSSSDDAARQILKGDWQLPTREIWNNLYYTSKYDWTWTSKEGYNGIKVTSNTDARKTLFLPAAGYVDGTSFYDVGSFGHYWSGTASSSSYAYNLEFDGGGVYAQARLRLLGIPVRPVRLVAVD